MRPSRSAVAVLGVLAAGALIAAGCGGKSTTYSLVRDGNHAYGRGDANTALNDYRQAQVQRPDLPVLNYDAGNALYAQGDYTRGVTESQQAAQNGDDALRARAYYSIGADDYRQGKLQDALGAYKNALRIDPSDTDAKYNVELIQRQLDREAAARQGLPTPTPEPTQPAGQQGQNGQSGGQQATPPTGNGQQGNSAQQGSGQQGQQGSGQQSQPGQGQSGQQGSGPNGQNGANGQQGQAGQQPGNGQQGAGSGATQPGQSSSNQAGQGTGGSAGSNGPGTTGTPQPSLRAQQQQADQNLQGAISAYQKDGAIDDALKILDALAQQQALEQQAQANSADPHSQDK